MPGQQRLGLDDGDDIGQPVSDGQAVPDQNDSFGFGEGHAPADFAAQDFVLLPQIGVFKGDAGFEQAADSGQKKGCRLR